MPKLRKFNIVKVKSYMATLCSPCLPHSPLSACPSALGCSGTSAPDGGIAQHGHTVLPAAGSWNFRPVQEYSRTNCKHIAEELPVLNCMEVKHELLHPTMQAQCICHAKLIQVAIANYASCTLTECPHAPWAVHCHN